jgi:hypothetical protein
MHGKSSAQRKTNAKVYRKRNDPADFVQYHRISALAMSFRPILANGAHKIIHPLSALRSNAKR